MNLTRAKQGTRKTGTGSRCSTGSPCRMCAFFPSLSCSLNLFCFQYEPTSPIEMLYQALRHDSGASIILQMLRVLSRCLSRRAFGLLTMSGSKPNVVFVLGPPGSGKGTQCQKIVEVRRGRPVYVRGTSTGHGDIPCVLSVIVVVVCSGAIRNSGR